MEDRAHRDLKDLIAAYVLGAASADELPRIRSHILTCEECMIEADALGKVAASLAVTVDPVPVPAGFSERVLAAAEVGEPRAAERSPRGRRTGRLASVLAYAALAIAVVVLGAALLDARGQIESDRRTLASLLHNESKDFVGEPGAAARIVPTRGGGMFVATGLDRAPAEHTYQLWLIEDGLPHSGGTFEASSGVIVLELSQDVTAYDAAAVTIEPEGGSDAPTGRPVIATDTDLL